MSDDLLKRIEAGAKWMPGFGVKPSPPRLSVLASFIKETWPELNVWLEPCVTSTDRDIPGSRLRWPGKGRKGNRLTVREPGVRRDGLADPGLLLRHESSGTYRHNGEVCRWIVSRLETKKKRKKKRRG